MATLLAPVLAETNITKVERARMSTEFSAFMAKWAPGPWRSRYVAQAGRERQHRHMSSSQRILQPPQNHNYGQLIELYNVRSLPLSFTRIQIKLLTRFPILPTPATSCNPFVALYSSKCLYRGHDMAHVYRDSKLVYTCVLCFDAKVQNTIENDKGILEPGADGKCPEAGKSQKWRSHH